MSMSLFYEGLKHALHWEGPETNDRDDSGGHTKYGISKAAHPEVDISKLTLDEAQNIYLKNYWLSGYNCIDEFLALKLFDLGINMGPKSAVRILQATLNQYYGFNLTIDGVLGPMTVTAANSVNNSQSLYSAFIYEVSKEYARRSARKKNKKYFLGWLNRLYDHPRVKRIN